MRFVPSFFERVSGQFIGDEDRPNGRVTVKPYWLLKTTPPIYGGLVRGPYRYWQDKNDSVPEWEVPNIKSIEWDRSEDQDIASCTITLYNMWHEENTASPELEGQLGKPGYFWPKRGIGINRWNQLGGRGAYRKDGFWDPNFSWQNVLVPFALLHTYEGYGGNPEPGNYRSINHNLTNENILKTGTWIIETVSAGSSGEMVLSCKDIGVLLLKELCFPPTVPAPAYPVDYHPPGKSLFDSFFGAKPKTGVSPASFGEVHKTYHTSSLDAITGVPNSGVAGHHGSHTVDGKWSTYGFSEAYATPSEGLPFFQYALNGNGVSKVAVKPWAGGYECYLSIRRGGVWLGSTNIPGGSIPYVNKVNFGLALPDGMEQETYIEVPSTFFDAGAKHVTSELVRLTFKNLYYSGVATSGNYYRAGIREVSFLKEGASVSPYSSDFGALPWTYSMASHPTRGYWVLDSNGTVHGFGDAADYDSSAYGPVPLSNVHPNNIAISIKPHPSGKGYWVLDITGKVYAYGEPGTAQHYGEVQVSWPGVNVWGEDGIQAWDIAPTHTGNGYWVIYGNGVIYGFGDAVTPSTPGTIILPTTNVGLFMNTVVHHKWLIQRNGNGICGHPTDIGFWATTGSGEVYAFGAAKHHGQLHNRVYNSGMADEFKLVPTEFTKSIECTASGNGYWIAFGSGHIAAFGDAINQGKTYIYDEMPNFNINLKTIQEAGLWGFFRALVWSIARDPDGTGFWVLIANGSVGHFNAEFWGQPGYNGKTGYRWHEGNYDGDPMSIVKELLAWSGWVLYDPLSGDLDILGQLESSGINTDNSILADKFDKRPILDIIKELIEVVGYSFQIREDGGVVIHSRNVWRSGNFDEDGIRIHTDGNSYDRVPASDPNATEFIPLIDENIDLYDYQASLSGSSMRSRIVIGSEEPSPKNPNVTGSITHLPQSAWEQMSPGVPALRGIPVPAMWISKMFTNPEEMKIMAELIDLNSWFAARTGNAVAIANPCISVGDQVKFAERNTSEYNIHYVRGIRSSHNLETGEWTYTYNTHWLGDKDNWVITSDNVNAPVSGSRYFQISESVDRWQQGLGLGLEKGAGSRGWSELSNIVDVTGSFNRVTMGVEGHEGESWKFQGSLTLYKEYNNSLNITINSMTPPLGTYAFLEIINSNDEVIYSLNINDVNRTYNINALLGSSSGRVDLTYRLTGYPTVVGNGFLSLTIRENDLFKGKAEDSLLVTG